MCLLTVSEKKPSPTGIGWKYLIPMPSKGGYETPIWNMFLEADKWNRRLEHIGIGRYPPGFHIYTRKPQQKTLVCLNRLYRVEYRAAHTAGIDDTMDGVKRPTIVADEIRVLGPA